MTRQRANALQFIKSVNDQVVGMSTLDWQKRIVVVVGAPRSGTTWIARELAKILAAEYMEEPNWLWRYGNLTKKTDFLTQKDATPDVIQHIQSHFLSRSKGGRWIVEKTPANTVRSDFVRLILPKANFVFVTRTLDDIRASLQRKVLNNEDRNNSRTRQSSLTPYLRTFRQLFQYSKKSEIGVGLLELFERLHEKTMGRMLIAPRSPELVTLAQNEGIQIALNRQLAALGEGSSRWMQSTSDDCSVEVISYENCVQSPELLFDLAEKWR